MNHFPLCWIMWLFVVKCQSAIVLLWSYVLQPFNSQRWLTCKFSLKYPHIQQTSSEITQTYQVQDFILIAHQILVTHLQGNLWQLEERINNQILGVEGLIVRQWVVLPFSVKFGGQVQKNQQKICKKLMFACHAKLWELRCRKEVHFVRLTPRVF